MIVCKVASLNSKYALQILEVTPTMIKNSYRILIQVLTNESIETAHRKQLSYVLTLFSMLGVIFYAWSGYVNLNTLFSMHVVVMSIQLDLENFEV
jgi:hypothetical protein